jgi:hypothetical protein
MIRRPEALANVPDPAWDAIRDLADQNPSTTIVDADPVRGEEVLWRLQVTARSHLGALALNSGGVLADHGWFRLLGGGSPHLADLAAANNLGEPKDDARQPPHLLIGYDALSGRFAIDGGGLGVGAGEVCYFGPDSLAWEGLGGGHADFISAAIGGHLADTFGPLRWPGWQEEVARLLPDQGFAAYPPPFSREGQDMGAATRRAVPVQELFDFYDEAARQLGP